MDKNNDWNKAIAEGRKEISHFLDCVEALEETTFYMIASNPDADKKYHATYGVFHADNDDPNLFICTAYAALGNAIESLLGLPPKALNDVTTNTVMQIIDLLVARNQNDN